ncbi:MAG: putative dNTP triphosphohydrolase [Hydrogenibacillus schlegelii]|uniref:Putative dNTP triphosphohydrolase n=1 Tax=Hydrogenibacillus schlegelii TaxID=1484 RepID=A0A2T5GC75_HYDSH|nr:HD domain-containing protein [Hydrogenibacillus schlegelii]PTQ53794.1 MAG: putative dNTP triphosphohydrolase [Hydrogenibacillus schlegelii]
MKTIRDPVHNLIQFDLKTEGLIVRLIDTPEFQRLHHIRQLGLSFFTYPGATHTRFSHSIGVAHLMKRFVDRLLADEGARRAAPGGERLKEDRLLAMAAALLHDIGHGPLSHAIEAVTGVHHEAWSRLIVTGGTAVTRVLEAERPGLAREVADVIGRSHANRAIVKLLSSQLDVDRTDYLLRDAHMTGARYGALDLEWLIHSLRLGVSVPREGSVEAEVGLDLEKGLSIAEDFMMARFYMYRHVYLHKTTRAAELMVQHLLLRAAELAEAGALTLPPALGAVLALRSRRDPEQAAEAILGAFLTLTDATVWSAFFDWQEHPDPVLRTLSRRLIARDLYKALPLPEGGLPTDRLYELHEEAAERLRAHGLAGLDGRPIPGRYALFLDTEETIPYKDPYLLPAGRRPAEPTAGGGSDKESGASAGGAGGTGVGEVPAPAEDDARARGGESAAAPADGDAESTVAVWMIDREGRAVELSRASELIRFLREHRHAYRRVYVPREIREEMAARLRALR